VNTLRSLGIPFAFAKHNPLGPEQQSHWLLAASQ